MTVSTGDVVWHTAPFKDPSGDRPPSRPWLIVSNASHPFHGREYVVLGMTTRRRDRALRVEREDWIEGGLEKSSFVSPWSAMTLKRADMSHRVGALGASLVDGAVAALFDCLGTDVSSE